LKDLLRIMIFLSIILIVFFYFDSPAEENELLEAPQTQDPLPAQDPVEDPLEVERPSEGLSTYIGNPSVNWKEDFGEPSRIEPSAFSYEWWVYDTSYSNYLMAGVKDGRIVQVYTAGTATNAAPFEIGQTLDDLYRFTIIENEITIKYGSNIYIFNLSAEDLNRRLLVSFEDVYAQLYIDKEDRKLEAVRFMDAETLVRHQPYDMMFSGELLPPINPSSSLQQSIDEANARQIVDLTNIYRLRHQKNPLAVNPAVGILAKEHSQNTAKQNFSTEEIELKSLEERLTDANIVFEEAAENTATQYLDAGEAVHGWINSPKHRDTLLSSRFNQIGIGVFGKYYTQDFIRQEPAAAEN
jgi:uncharacterized protein YkwD